jgi:acylphosphatase
MNPMKARAHIIISGRVQGVFFRSEAKREADRRNLKGWIRNLPKGDVEAVLEGEEENVEALIEFCKHGPPHAKVTSVHVDWESPRDEFGEFEMRY